MNRKLAILLGPVAALVMFGGAVWMASVLMSREYQQPYRAPAAVVDATPRAEGLAAEQAEAERQARAKPYEEAEYRAFPIVGSRVAIWVVAQLHLLFAAFVLAVPIFALILEVIGYKTGDLRYDRLAHEFTKLLSVSFSLTATFGAFLTFMLIILYPKFTNYLMSVFSPTFLPYVLLFFFEALFLYTYYYGWGKFHPLVHIGLGLGLNIVGTAIMFIANAWLTFMMSPAGISDSGAVLSVMDAVTNFTWMPINVHRLIANVAFGGAVAAAYAAFKFLQATDRRGAGALRLDGLHRQLRRDHRVPAAPVRRLLAREGDLRVLADARAHHDGRGVLVAVHHPGRPDREPLPRRQLLPLARHGARRGGAAGPEVHQVPAHRDRALLHGLGDAAIDHRDGLRGPGDGRLVAPGAGLPGRHVGEEHGREHPDPHDLHELPPLPPDGEDRDGGVGEERAMRRSSPSSRVASIFVIFLGVYGYFVEASVRIGLSVPQVLSVLFAMVSITAIDIFLFRGAKTPRCAGAGSRRSPSTC
jgi:hypothetical protein